MMLLYTIVYERYVMKLLEMDCSRYEAHTYIYTCTYVYGNVPYVCMFIFKIWSNRDLKRRRLPRN